MKHLANPGANDLFLPSQTCSTRQDGTYCNKLQVISLCPRQLEGTVDGGTLTTSSMTLSSCCELLLVCLLVPGAGERSVWDYWFQQFTPAYAGLPSLGTMESIYNQQSVSALSWS